MRPRSSFNLKDRSDVLTLRTKHRIVGSLIGSLPRNPQQNIFFSMPLSLLPEEVYVLVQEGLCNLYRDDEAHSPPTSKEIAEFDAAERAWAMDVRNKRLEAAAAERSKRFRPEVRALAEAADVASGPSATEVDSVLFSEVSEDPAADTVGQKRTTASDSLLSRVKTSSADLPWYRPAPAAKSAFPWPKREQECNRAAVFYDLWKRGLFLSSGSKFGANYLAYPGDPLRYHSHFTVTVVGPCTKIPLVDIVTLGRLGTVVKKNRLVAIASEEGPPKYYSTEWTGWS
ncbi:tRNA intron endonuclease [Hyaloraphidium curvatum]|nr:tRNA intron endonuclease [Hyaloraphidium curvatum]